MRVNSKYGPHGSWLVAEGCCIQEGAKENIVGEVERHLAYSV